MNESSPLLDPALLARLAQSRVSVRHPVDGTLSGLHRSLHHGSSVEFAEHKEYSPGDDVRHIDWKVYARSDRHYVRRFEDETNLRATFVVDCSGSMGFRGDDSALSKLDFAKRFAAHLGYVLLRQQDAVGLVAVADEIRSVLPPRARSAHVLDLTHALESLSPSGTTDLCAGLRSVVESNQKRGLVYVLSDFFTDPEPLFQLVRQLRAHRHHVAFVQILDPDELRFPFRRLTLFRAMESSSRLLAEPRAIRGAYLKALHAFLARLSSGCRDAGVVYQSVETTSDLHSVLATHLRVGEGGRGGA